MEALHRQLLSELHKVQKPLTSIFIGGGTPSSIDGSLYAPIFQTLLSYIDNQTEITIEANPNSLAKEWLVAMRSFGVTRISFGIQSFNEEKLKFLGRNHSKEDGIAAIHLAKEVGFRHINLDLIYDTAIDSDILLGEDLAIVATLPIDHISAYSLTIEEGTKFFKTPSKRIENIAAAQSLFEALSTLGFEQYEISNFAKGITSRSKHNFGYWNKEEYLGIGAGAVGNYNHQRLYPPKNIETYITNPLVYEEIEDLCEEDERFEQIFLGLRSAVGIPLDLLRSKEQKAKITTLIEEEKIFQKGGRIFNRDYLVSDAIALYLEP